ncbi:MAG TPA: hypothetical protein VJA66_05595 [Thermoanaerobaculia bacterium]
MANGTSRFLAIVLSLIIGFAVGWFAHVPGKPHPPRPDLVKAIAAKDWDVTIEDDPCDLNCDDPNNPDKPKPCDVQAVTGGKTIKWHSRHGQNVYIDLQVPDCSQLGSDPPFDNATYIGSGIGFKYWRIGDGTKSNIDSGKTNPKLCYSKDDPSTWIKYEQFIQIKGEWQHCDGWIIVKG